MQGYHPKRNHYLLAELGQSELLSRIRYAADMRSIVLWEMVGINDIYTTVTAGPICAGKLGINQGEIVGYSLSYSYTDSRGRVKQEDFNKVTGKAFGDAMMENRNLVPPLKDIIGTLRWRTRLAAK